ncbi:MAG: DUF488 domain-containing protein [Arthrobacter sp.]
MNEDEREANESEEQARPFPPRSPGIVSCGYQSRTAEELIVALLARHVEVVADVRLTPMSRTKGLSKRALTHQLSAAGIEYRHYPALGNPKENRAGFAQGDPAAAERYRKNLREELPQQAIAELTSTATASVVAVMCFELREEHCHRRILLTELAARGAAVHPPI